jgi:hypothetical protein
MSTALDINKFFEPKETPKTLDEIMGSTRVESIEGERDLHKLSQSEAFMHELVTIFIPEDHTEWAYTVVTPTVNGINQPVIRGMEQTIKRKYVEALVHTMQTSYRDHRPNANEPDKILRVPKTVISYPFEVRKDTDIGRAWYKDLVMKEAQVASQQ